MSEFHVEVVRIGAVEKHPNADSLSVTVIHGGYPCVMRTGDFREGDLAVYVPVDAIVPADDPRWAFLAGSHRIKAKRLRGIFSMGVLTAADPGWVEGQDVAEVLGIIKHEPDVHAKSGGWKDHSDIVGTNTDAPDPKLLPHYTDIEPLRKYHKLFEPGEQVVITEKIHGENMRAIHDGTMLHVGSRTRWKTREAGTAWWRAALACNLDAKLAEMPMLGLFGESHGYTGGFVYGTGRVPTLRLFDVFRDGHYLDYAEFETVAEALRLPIAPVLYRGPWMSLPDVAPLAEGLSTLDPSHVREGIVVRPIRERWDHRCGRVILKLHGEGFHTRREST